uniref:Uncharacterized protein n=1 Tax=Clytia hemisphaerica TaxID=252671 RepID=A0A7M5V0E0_9CNID
FHFDSLKFDKRTFYALRTGSDSENFIPSMKMRLKIYLLVLIIIGIVHYCQCVPIPSDDCTSKCLNTNDVTKCSSKCLKEKRGRCKGRICENRAMPCDGRWFYYTEIFICGGMLIAFQRRVFEYHC